MSVKSLDEITTEVLQLYEKDKSVDEIASIVKIQRYLVESILIAQYKIYFR